ncbi:AMP-binding protein, partial [Amycolatopsis rhizosphaerae]
PFPNHQVHVLGPDLRPVPPGVPGEIHIGGPGLARGYLGKPALTAQRFIPDPFATQPGARLYRTGDRARFQPDGTLTYLGRTDNQIQIRGFRVEPAEIENTLQKHPDIHEAVVIARQDAHAVTGLVAYVVAEPDTEVAEVREHCARRLPDYMVPAVIVPLGEMPLSANGKIDRRALPAPEDAQLGGGTPYAPAETPVQTVVTDIWREVLDVERVGIHDDFFALGGHSLLALRLTSQLQEAFGGDISLALLYRARTPAALAAELERPARRDWPSSLIPLRPGGSRPPLFCVHPRNGTVFSFTGLARALTDDRPVYGVQARSLDPAREPHTDVGEMAAAYVEDVLRVRPEGPYLLCGYSLGGLVAYEMARQLHALGHEVARLILLDARPDLDSDGLTVERLDAMDDVDILVREFAEHLPVTEERLRALSPEERLPHVLRQAELTGALPGYAEAAGVPAEYLDLDAMANYVRIACAHTRAALTYRPSPYAGPALLLRCADPAEPEGTDPGWGWAALVKGGLVVRTTPGEHLTLLDKPHVLTLAERIQEYLAEESGNR